MERTIDEWLKCIKDPVIRDKALFNYKTFFKEPQTELYNNFRSALTNAFAWDGSPEQYGYWDKIYSEKTELLEFPILYDEDIFDKLIKKYE